MPHWQVLAVSATCELICFQADLVVTEQPLHAAALGRSQSQLAQTWGRSAASRTDWRNNISKVTGNRCWIFRANCSTRVIWSSLETDRGWEIQYVLNNLLFMDFWFSIKSAGSCSLAYAFAILACASFCRTHIFWSFYITELIHPLPPSQYLISKAGSQRQNYLKQLRATHFGRYCSCMIKVDCTHCCSVSVVQRPLYFGSLL